MTYEGKVCHKKIKSKTKTTTTKTKQVTYKKTDNTKQKNMQLARAQQQSSSQEGAHKGGLCARQRWGFFPVCGGPAPHPWAPCDPFLFPEAIPVT